MSELLQRVARAILKRRFYDCEPDAYEDDLDVFYLEMDADHVIEAQDEARAAIEALREPTDMMGLGLPADYRAGSHSATQIWKAMIDAALSESGPAYSRRE